MAIHHYLNADVKDIAVMDVANGVLNARVLVMDQGIVCGIEMHLDSAYDGIVLGDVGKHDAFLIRRILVP